MTDTPIPPPTSPTAPLAVPPGPPHPPVGRPRIWQAGLVCLAFGLLAGGSCAAFLTKVGRPGADPLALVFVLTVPIAAAAFTLLVFRIWRRRQAEAWPSLGQCLLIGAAGAVLAAGGCGVWAATMEQTPLMPLSFGFGAAFIVGLAFAVGATELFVIGLARVIFRRPGAR